MIAHVSGEVVEKTANALIIDVGGLGYEVQVAAHDFEAAALGQAIKLYTHDHLRENAHELFGFSHLTAKRLFELLISVSGVGPKMALAILSLGNIESTRSAIAMGDSSFVQRASGVGKRIAERITVDLRDKVGAPGTAATSDAPMTGLPGDDALDALLALGYTMQQANEALAQVDTKLDVQARIKLALRVIGG
ncbi:MAG TPA: Holliday junction branch migration protein RuvA [Candidatus Saccharimonadales bacterium]|nr:Holliday junction branch migration protein RuvA [Candidatus Saccharimonadales bacterium]